MWHHPVVAMDDVDWSGLFHAQGRASDTPRHLRALLGDDGGDDAWAAVNGYSHLWSTTLRRDRRAWPATAPTALLVTELLDDPLLGPDDPSLRDAMLAYLQTVAVVADLGVRASEIRSRAESRKVDIQRWTADYLASDADHRSRMWEEGAGIGDLVLDQATLACFDIVPEILERVLPHLGSGSPKHRACAAAAVGALARHPSISAQRPALVERLVSMAGATDSPHDLASIVIAIGQLDGDTRPWLHNVHPGVRGCAALAPSLGDDEMATGVLLELAQSPRAFAASFGDSVPPMHFQMAPYPPLMIQALLERVSDAEALAPALIAALPLGPKSSLRTRSHLLRALFGGWSPNAGLSPLQRKLAELVADCDRLWDLDEQVRAEIFQPGALPRDRQAWSAMAGAGQLPPRQDDAYSAENIVVFEGFAGIRSVAGMFFGTRRSSPDLPDRIASTLRSEYERAVADGEAASVSIEVESACRFTIDVRGHGLPSIADGPCGLDAVFSRVYPRWPTQFLSFASALSSRVWVQAWADGHVVAGEYVDGMALGPGTADADQSRDGYRVTFEMDDAWRPLGAMGDF